MVIRASRLRKQSYFIAGFDCCNIMGKICPCYVLKKRTEKCKLAKTMGWLNRLKEPLCSRSKLMLSTLIYKRLHFITTRCSSRKYRSWCCSSLVGDEGLCMSADVQYQRWAFLDNGSDLFSSLVQSESEKAFWTLWHHWSPWQRSRISFRAAARV